MIEILSVLEQRSDFDMYETLVSKYNTDIDIARIIKWIDKYYHDTSDTTIDWLAFETYFFVNNPLIKDTKKSLFQGMFARLAKGNTTLKSTLIDTFLKRYHAERVSFLGMEIAEGKKDDMLTIQTELDEYMDVSGEAEEIGNEAVTTDLTELTKTIKHGTGLRWRLPCLNESMGPIRLGNFILFGGRPDSGKTTLLCSEITHMAEQLPDDKQVLYFTNEEGGEAVQARIVTAMLGISWNDIEKDILTYGPEYVKLLGGNKDKIRVIDKHNMHISHIEWWLKRENPGLIVIDQLRKVRGFDDMKGVNRLERLFQHARELSKTYAPVITVTQLDGDAENVQYPDMRHLYESKTAVQGEMDAICNIGRLSGSVPANLRYLNVVKNKLPTPDDPSMRNGRYEVLIDGEIARFK